MVSIHTKNGTTREFDPSRLLFMRGEILVVRIPYIVAYIVAYIGAYIVAYIVAYILYIVRVSSSTQCTQ